MPKFHRLSITKYAVSQNILVIVALLTLALPGESAPVVNTSKTTVDARPRPSLATLQFHPRVVSNSKYTYVNNGENLDHTLQKLSAKSGNFRLDEEIVDDAGLISIRLFYLGKPIFDKHLPKWRGLCEDSYTLIDPLNNISCNKAPVFRDINGDGIAEMILINDSGSAHGPVEQTIYQIQPRAQPLHKLSQATLQSPEYVDLEKNGTFSIMVYDQAFAYWKNSAYCDFAPPLVVLSLKGNTWVPNAKLMAKAAPNKVEFEKVIHELNNTLAPCDKLTSGKTRAITPDVWNAMTKLVYEGNAESAREILDRLYTSGTTLILTVNNPDELKSPKGMPKLSRDQFWKDFWDNVKKSEYAKTLLEMNNHKVMQAG
jgi:hypothetical protein